MISLSYGSETPVDFDPLFVRGFDDVDDVQLIITKNVQALNGTFIQKVQGFQRVVTVAFGYIASQTNRVWLSIFIKSSDMKIEYANELMRVVFDGDINSEWPEGFELARSYTLRFIERDVRTELPISWGGIVTIGDESMGISQ